MQLEAVDWGRAMLPSVAVDWHRCCAILLKKEMRPHAIQPEIVLVQLRNKPHCEKASGG